MQLLSISELVYRTINFEDVHITLIKYDVQIFCNRCDVTNEVQCDKIRRIQQRIGTLYSRT